MNKVLQLASKLGIENSIEAQIIVFSVFRDAIRKLSPKLFKSIQHRDAVYNEILEALEELEDKLEDLAEKADDDD